MRLLLPSGSTSADDTLDDGALAEIYAYPEHTRAPKGRTARSYLRANFVSTLDGAATGPDGRSGSINTGADRDVFALLRALADVVIVGAGTARAEGYRRAVTPERWSSHRRRSGAQGAPATVVVTRSGAVPPRLVEDRDDAGEVLLATSAAASPDAVAASRRVLGADHVLVCGDEAVDPPTLLDKLTDLGLTRALCEGGPSLMRDLVAAGVVDELCLTLSPLMVGGDHTRILHGARLTRGTAPLTPAALIEADGTLLGRWVRP